jgi:putative ABC transport system ATP-binding protein
VTGPILTVERLTRRFRRRSTFVYALDGLSLELYPGQLAVAAGPRGCGKTTLLSILAGLEPFDGGRITTHPPLPPGVPLGRMRWRDIAYVPQVLTLLDELTTRENIEMPALLDPDGAGWPAEQVMSRLHLDHLADAHPNAATGAEQQRIAVARALRMRPRLLLADEPTSQQDPDGAALILDVLHEHARSGNAVLISSDSSVTADRVLRLLDGRLVTHPGP